MSDIVSSNSLLQLIRCICIAGKSTSRPDWGFNAAMDACLKAGQWKRSLELFREMSFLKLQKDAVSCNVAIMASSASSKWQHSLSVLNGQEADEISHTSCMTCTERKQWRLALIYLGQLGQQKGLRLNSISCNSAVSACSRGDHWHLAWELFACMSISRISTDAFTYSSLVSAFDQWELALCTLDVEDVEADEVVMNAAIDTCAHGGWTVGIKLLEDMRRKKIRGDLSDVSRLSRQDPRSGRVIEVRRVESAETPVAPVVTPVTYTALAFSCGAAHWEAAENLLAEMRSAKVGRIVWWVRKVLMDCNSFAPRMGDHCLEFPTSLAATRATHSIRLTIFVRICAAGACRCLCLQHGFGFLRRNATVAESIFLHVAHEGFEAGGHQPAQVNQSQKCKRFISHGMRTLALSIKFHVGSMPSGAGWDQPPGCTGRDFEVTETASFPKSLVFTFCLQTWPSSSFLLCSLRCAVQRLYCLSQCLWEVITLEGGCERLAAISCNEGAARLVNLDMFTLFKNDIVGWAKFIEMRLNR